MAQANYVTTLVRSLITGARAKPSTSVICADCLVRPSGEAATLHCRATAFAYAPVILLQTGRLL
jgi:hypothetical protein